MTPQEKGTIDTSIGTCMRWEKMEDDPGRSAGQELVVRLHQA